MIHSVLQPKRRSLDGVRPWHRAVNLVAAEVAPKHRAASLSTDWWALRTWEDDGGESVTRSIRSPLSKSCSP